MAWPLRSGKDPRSWHRQSPPVRHNSSATHSNHALVPRGFSSMASRPHRSALQRGVLPSGQGIASGYCFFLDQGQSPLRRYSRSRAIRKSISVLWAAGQFSNRKTHKSVSASIFSRAHRFRSSCRRRLRPPCGARQLRGRCRFLCPPPVAVHNYGDVPRPARVKSSFSSRPRLFWCYPGPSEPGVATCSVFGSIAMGHGAYAGLSKETSLRRKVNIRFGGGATSGAVFIIRAGGGHALLEERRVSEN